MLTGEYKHALDPKKRLFIPAKLREELGETFYVTMGMDNDVHAATLAEKHYGIGQKYEDFIYYNIGTGLSIGIVADGRLLRGSTNYSGEIGHMVTESDGAFRLSGGSIPRCRHNQNGKTGHGKAS